MELSWSTFLLEIINFLVLVWILKRFFYQPVLDVIARRRAGIEKTLTDAESVRAEAEKLQEQYEGRLADWERERQKAREDLAREIDAERGTRMEEMEKGLEKEREKAAATEARRQADAVRKIEEAAFVQAARFAGRLLEQASGPDLEARLLDVVTAELARLSDERVAEIRNAFEQTPEAVTVTSAYPVPEDRRSELKSSLERLVEPGTPVKFEQDGDLLAGVSITIGSSVLGANVRDELEGFAELARVD